MSTLRPERRWEWPEPGPGPSVSPSASKTCSPLLPAPTSHLRPRAQHPTRDRAFSWEGGGSLTNHKTEAEFFPSPGSCFSVGLSFQHGRGTSKRSGCLALVIWPILWFGGLVWLLLPRNCSKPEENLALLGGFRGPRCAIQGLRLFQPGAPCEAPSGRRPWPPQGPPSWPQTGPHGHIRASSPCHLSRQFFWPGIRVSPAVSGHVGEV